MPIDIILRRNVESLGRRGEIVKVAVGYARNYLLPRKFALLVTDASRRQIEREKQVSEAHEAEEKQAADQVAERLAEMECVIARKVGETETLYGSVTSADISEFLAGVGTTIEKRRIRLPEPIKQIGEFVVPIRLHTDVTAQLKVRVVKQEE